ncbi:hypothetical protein MPDQ_002472 [Monascus purpureus]|uniref:SET domain-containing protein n=1 Tax=Monascus purpureus TaxID=5098 RepID=A0A507QPC7_MONPU|nr:hypothetical protein MPDQ_002472 [Monascus purpureus]
MVTVPFQAMLTVDTIPESFIRKFGSPPNISVHGLLAAFLTHGDPEDLVKYDLWKSVWPTRKDFEDSMPCLWPRDLRISNSEYDGADISHPSRAIFLSPSISGRWNTLRNRKIQQKECEYESHHQNLLAQQEKRLRTAWDSALAVFPDTDWETFSYYWFIVNTRSFYYVMPGNDPPEDRNDALALVPFADYFNHSDIACDADFNGKEYTFRAAKSYERGEEIFMCYGAHPNDFLFAEYGFFLEENEWEVLYLDDIVFRILSPSDRDELRLQQYYGEYRRNYQMTSAGVCYRTEIVACMKYMTRKDWRNYVLGISTKGVNAAKSLSIIQGWIRAYMKEADKTLAALNLKQESSQGSDEDRGKLEMLLRRWRQIRVLCDEAFKAVSC